MLHSVLRSWQPNRTGVNFLFYGVENSITPPLKYGWHVAEFPLGSHCVENTCTYDSGILVTSFWYGIYRFTFLITFLYLSNPCQQRSNTRQSECIFSCLFKRTRGRIARNDPRTAQFWFCTLASGLHVTSWHYMSHSRGTEPCSLRA
jgi:hypothetical protein